MLRFVFRATLLLAVVVLVVGGLILGGRQALDQLRAHDRFTIPLADVECNPPPTMSRTDFLEEVQYLAGLPDQLHLLDEDLPRRVAEAFARHPWVDRVERVQVAGGRELRVQLRHRSPALAVPWQGELRAVDRHGILLPADAPTAGLPVFAGTALAPKGAAGTSWDDPAILAAAQKSAQ